MISETSSFRQNQMVQILHRHQVLHSRDRDGAFAGDAKYRLCLISLSMR